MLRQVITALIPNGLQVYACEVPVPNFGEKVAMGLAAQYVPPEARSVGDREISWGMLESPWNLEIEEEADFWGDLWWFMVIYDGNRHFFGNEKMGICVIYNMKWMWIFDGISPNEILFKKLGKSSKYRWLIFKPWLPEANAIYHQLWISPVIAIHSTNIALIAQI
jgi:hypothetical protein